jgi:hypothetical protein
LEGSDDGGFHTPQHTWQHVVQYDLTLEKFAQLGALGAKGAGVPLLLTWTRGVNLGR